MGALDGIRHWPVDHVAAALVTAEGAVESAGAVHHRFALASITKLLTATAVLVAVEEEVLGLDDPEGPVGATVRHLLAHASGIAPDGDAVIAPPGTRRAYSNRGYELLGELVTARSGIPFADYLTEAVLAPLHMTSTTLDGSPAAGARGTIDDLVRFARDWSAPQPIVLAAETRDRAIEPAFPDIGGVLPGFGRHDPNPWGLGPEIRGAKRPHWTGATCSPRTYGHFGRAGTLLWIDPDASVGLVVLTDREFGPWAAEAWPALGDAVLADHATPGDHAEPAHDAPGPGRAGAGG